MKGVVTIFSTALDLYLIFYITFFLVGRTGRGVLKERLLPVLWALISATCLYFLRNSQFYGVVYCTSLIILICVKLRRHLIRSLLYLAGSTLVVGMTNLVITCGLSFIFSEEMYVFDMPVIETIAGLICFSVYFSLITIARRYMARIETQLSKALLIFSLVMLAANTYILLYAMHFTKGIADVEERRQISIVFSLVSIGMLVEVLLVVLSVTGVYSYRKMLGYKDALLKAQTTHTEYIKQSNFALRKVKHDCGAHYRVISYLLEKEAYEDARAYAKELTEQLKSIGSCCDTGSIVVDALVGEKMAFARENEITFSFGGRLPKQCRIRETDQCILFSNILNNAFEAAMKVEAMRRKVDISIRTYEDELLIRASNTYNGKLTYENGELVTSKEEKDEHGFGLKNIEEIVKKYNGSMDVKVETEMFVVLVKV